jgi:hypothetical protein
MPQVLKISHADEQPATRGEKLLGDEDGERRAVSDQMRPEAGSW